jgi:hypothetical protein
MKIEYRNAKITDIPYISELCSNCFDGPFQWHQKIQQIQSVNSFSTQLTDRLNNLVLKGNLTLCYCDAFIYACMCIYTCICELLNAHSYVQIR